MGPIPNRPQAVCLLEASSLETMEDRALLQHLLARDGRQADVEQVVNELIGRFGSLEDIAAAEAD